MKIQKRPKRLTRLKVNEVSLVDRGAGEGVRVVLMKRKFGGADSLVRIGKIVGVRHQSTDDADPIAKAKQEIAENLAVAKSLAVTKEDPMETTSEVMKAAVAKVDGRIEAIIAKSERPISRDGAILKMATSRDPADIEAWQIHKALAVAPPTPVAEAAPVATSAAYDEMMAKASKRAAKHGTSVASEFSKLYTAPENQALAAADRSAHLAKAATGGVDPNESLVQALMASLGCDENHARGIALELRSKRPPASTLTVRTRDAA
jgi:hypothetical protein